MTDSRWIKGKGLELASEPVPVPIATEAHEISNTIGAPIIEDKILTRLPRRPPISTR